MGRKIYVGNLPYSATDQSLSDAFSQHGRVESSKVIMDRESGRSKGFGFVEMSTDEEASTAIAQMNGQEIDGRALTVNEAKPQESRSGGGGFGGGRSKGGSRW